MSLTAPSVNVRSLKDDPEYVKCPRCWHYHTVRMNFDCLCDSCSHIIEENFPDHEATPLIKEARSFQQNWYRKWASETVDSHLLRIKSSRTLAEAKKWT